mmetsp:Transcript_43442/g.86911  ORF Transcript_43442/g.86911 Transcript_43442/m.86911 type:complete len:229 (+) Transcript_43442:458-1144(+)
MAEVTPHQPRLSSPSAAARRRRRRCFHPCRGTSLSPTRSPHARVSSPPSFASSLLTPPSVEFYCCSACIGASTQPSSSASLCTKRTTCTPPSLPRAARSQQSFAPRSPSTASAAARRCSSCSVPPPSLARRWPLSQPDSQHRKARTPSSPLLASPRCRAPSPEATSSLQSCSPRMSGRSASHSAHSPPAWEASSRLLRSSSRILPCHTPYGPPPPLSRASRRSGCRRR